jgi:ABC-type glycerol-3-phosphate transport system substrate-binding protein
MKRFLAFIAIALLCAACAQGGSAPSSSASGITMYGTLDEGIVVHSK